MNQILISKYEFYEITLDVFYELSHRTCSLQSKIIVIGMILRFTHLQYYHIILNETSFLFSFVTLGPSRQTVGHTITHRVKCLHLYDSGVTEQKIQSRGVEGYFWATREGKDFQNFVIENFFLCFLSLLQIFLFWLEIM